MPLPIILGVGAAALAVQSLYRSELRQQDRRRALGLFGSDSIGRHPSESLPSPFRVDAKIGSVVCCEVYKGFFHTGVVIDDNAVLELHGSGLSRIVSFKRFTQDRSGELVFIASSSNALALTSQLPECRIANEVFCFYDYHVTRQNCYFHTWYCLTGQNKCFTSFSEFNEALSTHFGQSVFWDRAKI